METFWNISMERCCTPTCAKRATSVIRGFPLCDDCTTTACHQVGLSRDGGWAIQLFDGIEEWLRKRTSRPEETPQLEITEDQVGVYEEFLYGLGFNKDQALMNESLSHVGALIHIMDKKRCLNTIMVSGNLRMFCYYNT